MKMTRRKPKNPKKRLDVSSLRDLLADGRIWVKLGIVDGEGGSHFDLDGDDLLVEVRLMPDDERVTARWAVAGSGPSAGMWTVPASGTEVIVAIPDGEAEAGPAIVGVLSTGAVPDGVAENVLVISAGSEVLIHDGSGGAVPLATKADVDAVKSTFDAHRHDCPQAPAGTLPSSIPSQSVAGAIVGLPDTIPAPAGTTVLKGK